jgi:hypothetical protein
MSAKKYLDLFTYVVCVVGSLWIFAAISEIHVLLEIVPFLCVGGPMISKKLQPHP